MNFLKTRSNVVKFKSSTESRDQLIADYTPLVKTIARNLMNRLPANIEVEDLISAGMIGLMDALKKFDITKDIKFKTYAEFRIRGAILDELRSIDWVPRSMRDEFKKLTVAQKKVEKAMGRAAMAEEVAKELGISLDEYYVLTQKLLGSTANAIVALPSFGESLHEDVAVSSFQIEEGAKVGFVDTWKVLKRHMDGLPDKLKTVLILYYHEELSLKEIAVIMDVSESRVCQIHRQALARMEAKMRLKNVSYLDVV